MLFSLSITGTLVVGITDISEMIASTKEAGVTSYDKLRTQSLLKSLHSSSTLVLDPVATKSSGSPFNRNKFIILKYNVNGRIFSLIRIMRLIL